MTSNNSGRLSSIMMLSHFIRSSTKKTTEVYVNHQAGLELSTFGKNIMINVVHQYTRVAP